MYSNIINKQKGKLEANDSQNRRWQMPVLLVSYWLKETKKLQLCRPYYSLPPQTQLFLIPSLSAHASFPSPKAPSFFNLQLYDERSE